MREMFLSAWVKMPRLFRFLIKAVLSLALLFMIFRLAFWVAFEDPDAPLASADFWYSLWLGLRFDLRVSMIMFLPLFLLGGIKWLSPFTSRWHRYVWITYLSAFFAVITLTYIIDYGHYAYLHKRLDFTALRFLEDMELSAQMVWESYSVVWISAAYLFVVVLFAWSINKLLKRFEKWPAANYGWWRAVFATLRDLLVTVTGQTKRFPLYRLQITKKTAQFWKSTAVGLAALLVVFLIIQSRFSQYPLRWSDATFSKHPFASQLTFHPLHYFLDTWKNGRVTYDRNATAKYYDLIADYLGVTQKDSKNLNYKREVKPYRTLGERPNVVVVIVESFAAYKTSLSGSPLNPTPHMKEIADEGLYFKNFFTPSTGTARSIYTTITGIPDVEIKGTSSRNPLIVNQHSVANEFKGYEKFYFIGGSASWGNIRGILSKNIEGLHIMEKGSYEAEDVDVWGISDLYLLQEANKRFEKQKKPFFAIVQTSGDHRPYTIPEDNWGFKYDDTVPLEKLKKYGFESVQEYNAYRFMDHSIGHFIKSVRNSKYGKNTIFAFWGDHGIDGHARHALIADAHSQLGLGSLRVPFVIWAPGLIKEPKVIDKVASEVDALPTLAALAGQSYTETSFGRDLFNPKYDDQRYAFTITHSLPPKIGLVSDKFYYRMDAGGAGKLHKIYSNTPLEDHQNSYPDIAKKMRELVIGLHETMQYLPHFNRLDK